MQGVSIVLAIVGYENSMYFNFCRGYRVLEPFHFNANRRGLELKVCLSHSLRYPIKVDH